MNNSISLIGGQIIKSSIHNISSQDYIEIKLKDGKMVIIIGLPGGNLKIIEQNNKNEFI